MAKKTDEQIGNAIRTNVSAIILADNEEVQNVKIIMVATVKNTDSQATYTKGGKGIELNKYDATDEELNDLW